MVAALCLVATLMLFLVTIAQQTKTSEVNSYPQHNGLNESTNPSKTNLILMISITSGPHHSSLRRSARLSWLLPCAQSPLCDYRFFVDAMEHNKTAALDREMRQHGDMVFRGPWCPIMDRHPAPVNYGNSVNDGEIVGFPDYQLRAVYKVDWKVCFTKWAKINSKMAMYHAFVEDDSFLCTGHLLHLTSILSNMSKEERGLPFRTGYEMYDGFDDSSTFMSREVAEVFADHYLEEGFNCGELMATTDDLENKRWLSWGNSWMSSRCDWRNKLKKKFDLDTNKPYISSLMLQCNQTLLTVNAGTEKKSKPPSTSLRFPCPNAGVVLHNHRAADILLNDPYVEHMCEYMLFVDKVKDSASHHHLYRAASGNDYHDFSPVFINDGVKGWYDLIQTITEKEQKCLEANQSLPCLRWRRGRRQLAQSTYESYSAYDADPPTFYRRSRTPDPGPSSYFPLSLQH